MTSGPKSVSNAKSEPSPLKGFLLQALAFPVIVLGIMVGYAAFVFVGDVENFNNRNQEILAFSAVPSGTALATTAIICSVFVALVVAVKFSGRWDKVNLPIVSRRAFVLILLIGLASVAIIAALALITAFSGAEELLLKLEDQRSGQVMVFVACWVTFALGWMIIREESELEYLSRAQTALAAYQEVAEENGFEPNSKLSWLQRWGAETAFWSITIVCSGIVWLSTQFPGQGYELEPQTQMLVIFFSGYATLIILFGWRMSSHLGPSLASEKVLFWVSAIGGGIISLMLALTSIQRGCVTAVTLTVIPLVLPILLRLCKKRFPFQSLTVAGTTMRLRAKERALSTAEARAEQSLLVRPE